MSKIQKLQGQSLAFMAKHFNTLSSVLVTVKTEECRLMITGQEMNLT